MRDNDCFILDNDIWSEIIDNNYLILDNKHVISLFIASSGRVFCVFLNKEISYWYNSNTFRIPLMVSIFFISSTVSYMQNFHFWKLFPNIDGWISLMSWKTKQVYPLNQSSHQRSEGRFGIPDPFYTQIQSCVVFLGSTYPWNWNHYLYGIDVIAYSALPTVLQAIFLLCE